MSCRVKSFKSFRDARKCVHLRHACGTMCINWLVLLGFGRTTPEQSIWHDLKRWLHDSLSLFFSLYCILLNPVTFMLDIPRWQQIVTVHRAVFPTLAGSWRKNTPSVGIPRDLPELVKPPRPFKSVTGSCHCSCFYESQSACRLYMLVYIYIYLIL